MLVKLIKNDLKNTWKVMVPVCVLTIVLGLFAGIANLAGTSRELWFANLFILLYMMALPAISMFVIIYLCKYYYKKIYSVQAYFSFTIPATNTEVAMSKMITSCIWSVIFNMSLLVSILISESFDMDRGAESWHETVETWVFWLMLYTILSLPNLMSYFFSISIGQLWRKHRVLGTVLCQGITYFVLLVWIIFDYFLYGYISWDITPEQGTLFLYAIGIINSIILMLFFCGISIRTINKKLNLD